MLKYDNTLLPVLQEIINKPVQKYNWQVENTALVCVQHLLYTTCDLLHAFKNMNISPQNIHIMGKTYSTCPKVTNSLILNKFSYYPSTEYNEIGCFTEYFEQDIKMMWEKVTLSLGTQKIKKIIIMDDGGHCISNVPEEILNTCQVIGVEQTSSGLTEITRTALKFPIVEVASSATKQIIESPLIADAIVRKLDYTLPLNKGKLTCAVIGLGVIGNEVCKNLLTLHHNVIAYDINSELKQKINNVTYVNDISTAIKSAKYIFGCSGHDITQNLDFSIIREDKYLISCSSKDKEFLSLIKFIYHNCPYQVTNKCITSNLATGAIVTILNNGCPINFDLSGESVPAHDIQLTRGLLFGGALQAFYQLEQRPGIAQRYMLDPTIQRFIVNTWQRYGSKNIIKKLPLIPIVI